MNFFPIELSGEQWGRLSDAIQDAFMGWSDLAIFLRRNLDLRLNQVSSESVDFPTVAYKLIEHVQSRGLGGNLVAAMARARPGNSRVQAVAMEHLDGEVVRSKPDGTHAPLLGRELERAVREALAYQDAALWLQRMSEALPRVCHVRVDLGARVASGTGFLVAPDLVLTNHHVVDALIADPGGGASVACVFDFQRVRQSGVALHPGTSVALASAWLVDHAPPSPLDSQADAHGREPGDDELDYALLRLAEPVGDQPVGAANDPNAPRRGWITLPRASAPLPVGAPLFILQHPEGRPLQLAFDTEAVTSSNRTRLRYRTNTERGSSGSPCFDAQWNPVALHHAGDPNFAAGHAALYNQGVLLTAIVARLKRRGFEGALGR